MGNLVRITGVISIVFPLFVYIILGIVQKQHPNGEVIVKFLWEVFLFLYILVIFYMTIVRKFPPGTHHQLNLRLFWSYRRWQELDIRWQIFMNVFLFIPMGFLLRGKSIKTLILSLSLAIPIETLQYIFCLGLCELDDIFHNTVGAMIGCIYFCTIDYVWAKLIKKSNE